MSLSTTIQSGRVFRDPVHGLIEFVGDNRALGAILDTRAFQRLRRIKQMGFAWQVYVGAEHSRFGHALGAFHIASQVVQRLKLDEEVSLHIKVAALLHDLGHGPFSHTWEQVFDDFDHESWGARIVNEDEEMSGILRTLDPNLPSVLRQFSDKTYTPSYARKLVSSQLDVDRLDYLLRDGHYSGAGYATFDLEWILHALRVEKVRTGAADPYDLVVDYRRGMYAVEQYLFARTYMYAQVYHHKAVRAAERMFVKLLTRFCALTRSGQEPSGLAIAGKLARGQDISVDEFLFLDDYSLFSAIDSWAGLGSGGKAMAAQDPVLKDISNRLVRRQLFKTIDLGDDPAIIPMIEQQVQTIAQKVFGEAAPYYYYLDTARQIGYSARSDELHVVGHPRYGTVSLGRLLEDLPLGRPVSTIRLVCAPELVETLRPLAAQFLK